MGKIAVVFAGQGAQAPGMGASLYEHSPAACSVFQAAETLRPGTTQQCFQGTEAELRETGNTQPCLFVTEMAAAAALTEAGVRAHMTAGFSLGELSALTYAEALDFKTGLSLVMRRGWLMQKAAEQQPSSMAAVLRLPNETVDQLCGKYPHVFPVNYNCPGQVSVAGAADEMPAFFADVKAAGGRALPVNVSGGFHSPFMTPAAAAFAEELKEAPVSQPSLPVYSNCTGTLYGSDIRVLLASQIDHPVLWESIIRGMIEAGADTFLELGPGKTLCGLIKRIDPAVRALGIADYEELRSALQEVQPC